MSQLIMNIGVQSKINYTTIKSVRPPSTGHFSGYMLVTVDKYVQFKNNMLEMEGFNQEAIHIDINTGPVYICDL